jgi:hypothetical protein
MKIKLKVDSRSALFGWLRRETKAAILEAEDGRFILLAHGTASGILTVPNDDEGLAMLDKADVVVCCHPKMVAANYRRFFPKWEIAFEQCDKPVAVTGEFSGGELSLEAAC